MSLRSVRSLLLLCSALCLALFSCSLVRDLSVEQCRTDGDCRQFGDYSCSEERVCVANTTSASGSGNGGTEGEGGTATEGGAAGAPGAAECKTNRDCIDAHEGAPYICRQEACVPLTTPKHCPYVVAGPEDDPTSYLTRPGKPIIFGAYVPMDSTKPEGHPYTLIYKFALEELMTQTGTGANGRPFVMVLCQSTKPDIASSAAHLFDTVQVPAVLATLPSAELAALFLESEARPRKAFLLGPFEADSSLTALDDGGRVWHMLGPVTDLVPTYVPLFELAESYVRNKVKTAADRDKPLKVAVVNTDDTYSVDLANALPSKVSINGRPLNAKENRDFYQRIQLQLAGGDENPTAGAIQQLNGTGRADIVVSLAGTEFIDPLLKTLQMGKTAAASSFYILSPRNAFDKSLASTSFYTGTGMTFVDKLMAGVNYASVEDSTLYDKYLTDIRARYQGEAGLESRENLYDAAYFMMYSLAAAVFSSPEDFSGDDVVNGMKALTTGTSHATVGLGDDGNMIPDVLSKLKNGGKFALEGALGPPNFNPITGARQSSGSVWCVSKPGATPTLEYDVLRLDPVTPTQLTGSSFCYPDFFSAP